MSALARTAARETAAEAAGDGPSWSDREIGLGREFLLECGGRLSDRKLKLRLHGPAEAPVIVAAGGVSATRKVADAGRDKGWWRNVAGPGGPIDTSRFCVAGFEFLTGAGDDLPAITPADQARALACALEQLSVNRLHAFVGASYGGFVGLSFAALFSERVRKLCIISAAARPHPMATALRGVQRRIVALALKAGRPEDGVALARELAMTTYRTKEEFRERFSPAPLGARAGDPYDVCGYLMARGRAYAGSTSPARYLSLSDSLDRAQVDAARINAECLFIAAAADRLVPPEDTAATARAVSGPSAFLSIDSRFGHDAFLCDAPLFGAELKAFLEGAVA